MKDVAILTKFYKNYNYGGMLQGYALCRVIQKMGYSVDLISYDVTKNRNSVYPSIIAQARQYGAKAAVAKASEKIIGKGRILIRDLISERTDKFNQFMNETARSTDVYTDDSMRLLKHRYRVFVSGSDQVWNPNAVRNLYLQSFSAQRNRKISYAASIGRDRLSDYEARIMIPALRQFGSISVREKTAKSLLEEYLDSPISLVLDPTMLLSADEWSEVSAEDQIRERYAVVYFFSDSLKVRKAAESFCKKNRLKLIVIPYAKQEYNLTDQMGPGSRADSVGPKEFVSLIKHAEFVLTDSFHGAVFSLIHQIPFAVFERNKASHVSMNSRLYDLLDTFEESYRLIDVTRIKELDNLIQIDQAKIQRILAEKKKESLAYLQTAINKGISAYKAEMDVRTVTGYESDCSGCGACVAVCPGQFITMQQNKNGFTVPVINKELCIECGRCKRICPVLGNVSFHKPLNIFGAYTKIPQKESASGGLSHVISTQFAADGGAVYGAAYDNKLHVRIVRVGSNDKLAILQGSKYVQADMNGSISKVVDDLKSRKKILFTGTPCQIAGVKAVAKEHNLDDNLYTAEIICHGAPSPQMFADYLEWAEKHYGKKITSYVFRAKDKDSDKDFMIRFGFSDESELTISGFKDPYYKLFLSSKWFRESCYDCPFACAERTADLTLGDFWNVEALPGYFGKDRRISVILVNSEKGKTLLDSVKDKVEKINSSWNTAISGNANLYQPTKKSAGYFGYGEIVNKMKFFEDEADAELFSVKFIFNQLPFKVRRTVKRTVYSLKRVFGK